LFSIPSSKLKKITIISSLEYIYINLLYVITSDIYLKTILSLITLYNCEKNGLINEYIVACEVMYLIVYFSDCVYVDSYNIEMVETAAFICVMN